MFKITLGKDNTLHVEKDGAKFTMTYGEIFDFQRALGAIFELQDLGDDFKLEITIQETVLIKRKPA